MNNVSISPKAIIGNNCNIREFSVIEDDVIIGDNVEIGPSAFIGKGSRIGDGVRLVAEHQKISVGRDALIPP